MNPDYIWVTTAIEAFTFFVIGPAISIAIAYAAWRGKLRNFNPKRYAMLCIVSGLIAGLLVGF